MAENFLQAERFFEPASATVHHTGGSMQNISLHANPFALMMDPEAVLAAMERSERLNHLQSRVCRPLDKQEEAAEKATPFSHMRDDVVEQEEALTS